MQRIQDICQEVALRQDSPANILEISLEVPSSNISRTIDTFTRITEGIGHEFVLGGVRSAYISNRRGTATNPNLTRETHRH